MMEQCGDCLPRLNKDTALDNAIKRAQDYANNEQKSFAIYKEEGDYKFLEAFRAYQLGYGPVIEVLVYFNR